MHTEIDILRKARIKMLERINELSIEQLNHIPDGFNNNIIWNMGHLLASQESIMYKRSGQELHVDQRFVDAYKNGSRPMAKVEAIEIQYIKDLLLSSLDQIEDDLNQGIFNKYIPWTVSIGIEINTKENALSFLPYHEGLHQSLIQVFARKV